MTCGESNKNRKLKIGNPFIALLSASLIVIAASGCRSNGKHGELVSTTLSMSSYVDALHRVNPGHSTTYLFPVLEIYNEAGVLIYRDNASMTNARILREFPGSVQNLPPKEDAPRLVKVLEEIPDFKPWAREIVGKKKLTILSVGLEDCRACSIQEQALDGLEKRLVQQPAVAILEINVTER